MKTILRYVITILLLLPAISRADWFYDFVRITCIPEARFFQFESKSLEGSDVFMETQFDEKLRAQRLAAWVKKGYYDPSRLEFECRSPASTYKLVTTQMKSSVDTPIIFSLYRDGKLIIDNVTLGDDNSDGTSIHSIEISEPPQGWGTIDFNICFEGAINSCNSYDQVTKSAPINQQVLKSFTASKTDGQHNQK